MITKVRLVNWRSHLNSELEFTKGTNVLLGHIGSGKSSILDSICFGFFGTFPALQSKKLKLDEIIMTKPIEKDRAEVEVFFQTDDKQYSVKRVVEKKKGTTYSEIREDGKLLEAPSTQRVNEIVEKVLKTDYELFTKAIYSEQNSLDYFLTIPKGQRMRKIDELLMISKFEKARSNSISLINKMMERKLGKQSVIQQADTEALENSIHELKIAFNKLSVDKEVLGSQLKTTIREKDGVESDLSDLKSLTDSLQILKNEENSLVSVEREITGTLKSLENGVKNLDNNIIERDLKNIKRVIEEIEMNIFEKQRRHQKLQDQTSKLKAELNILKMEKMDRLKGSIEEQTRIKNEIDSIRKSFGKDLDKEIEKKKIELEKLVGETEALKIKIKEMQDALEQLSSLGVKCPVCEHKLTPERKIILFKQKKSQIENLMDTLTKDAKRRDESYKVLKGLEVANRNLETLIMQIKDLDGLKKDLESQKDIFLVESQNLTKLEKELKQSEVELYEMQKNFNEFVKKGKELEIIYMKSKDYVEKSKRLEQLAGKRKIVLKQIDEIQKNLAGKKMTKLEKEFRSLLANEREFQTKIASINDLMTEKQSRLNDFEKTITLINKEKNEIQKLDKLIKDLQIFSKSLELTQIELRKEFIASVNYTVNNIWQTLYPYQDFSNIRLSVEEGDYTLQLQTRNGEWVNVEGIASGGERSLSALALRIAFSLVLAPQIRLLILDEPTSNLDAKAISELSQTLRERIGDFINQTFLITHTPELEDSVNGFAYRLERDKSTDSPTKVIQLN